MKAWYFVSGVRVYLRVLTLGAAHHLVKDENGVEKWVPTPLVKATGRLRTANGRMGISKDGSENEKYGFDPYAED